MLVSLSQLIDSFNNKMGKLVAYFTFFMAFITFAIVVFRYGFNIGSIAMQESLVYLHGAVFLAGSAFTYQQNAHVRVDVFYRQYSIRQKNIVDLIGCVLFMLPLSTYLTYVCWDYVAESWRLLEGSREPGGLPFVYILKSLLLVFSISFVLQALSQIIKHSLALFRHDEESA